MAYSTAAPTLDPHKTSGAVYYMFLYPAYDRLMRITAEGEIEPMLATDWAFGEDGKFLDLTLRGDVTFSDGTAFDAEAVKANLERAISLPDSTLTAVLSMIESVEVLDDLQVRIHLAGPGGALPSLFTGHAGMMISPAAFDNEDLDRQPVGAGPYVLVRHDVGNELVYERRDDYWDNEVPAPPQLTIRVMPDDSSRLNAVAAGEVDATTLREQMVDQAEALGVSVVTKPRLAYYSFNLSTGSEKVQDARVRKAISLALDRTAIGEALFGGRCVPTVQPFPAGHYAHNETIPLEEYDNDSERARQLLADAGVTSLSLTTITPNITAYQRLAEVVQQQLAEVGITLELKLTDAAVVGPEFRTGNYDSMIAYDSGAADASVTFLGQYGKDAYFNIGEVEIPGAEELLLEGQSSDDPAERGKAYKKLVELALEFGPYNIDICHRTDVYGKQDNVHGLEVFPTGGHDFREVWVEP
jgi:peptide/nickel transport system substrate-binding protein